MSNPNPALRKESEDRDLGFGKIVSDSSRRRLLNRDGSFNVRREGLPFLASLSPHHELLAASWPRFLSFLAFAYVALNLLFGLGFFVLGRSALNDLSAEPWQRFLDCFFFSIQTFAGIGYGRLNPATLAADVLVAVESFAGLLGLALATGLVFARWSRPSMRIQWSEHAVIAPYRGMNAFQIRLANRRRSQLIELNARMILTWFDDRQKRVYLELEMERDRVSFFPLSWTMVHAITAESPLAECDSEELEERHAEILILLNAIDERTSDTVHVRTSYRWDEILWDRRFVNLFLPARKDGSIHVDLHKLGETEPA